MEPGASDGALAARSTVLPPREGAGENKRDEHAAWKTQCGDQCRCNQSNNARRAASRACASHSWPVFWPFGYSRAGGPRGSRPAGYTDACRPSARYLPSVLPSVSGSAHPQAACVRLPASYAMALRQYLSGSLRSSAGGTHTHARARERERERASERERGVEPVARRR